MVVNLGWPAHVTYIHIDNKINQGQKLFYYYLIAHNIKVRWCKSIAKFDEQVEPNWDKPFKISNLQLQLV